MHTSNPLPFPFESNWILFSGIATKGSVVSHACDWECYMTCCKLPLFNMVEISRKQCVIIGKTDFPTDFPIHNLIWKFYE